MLSDYTKGLAVVAGVFLFCGVFVGENLGLYLFVVAILGLGVFAAISVESPQQTYPQRHR